jgi:putative ABC transport system permease protein
VGTLWQDIRLGFRLLWKAPGFTVVAISALALGIGANAAIFSVVDAVLLRPLPFHDPGRLLVILEKSATLHNPRMFVSPADFLDWRSTVRSLEGLAAVQALRMNLNGGPNGHIDPEELGVERVSASLFPTLGVQPVLGRSFRPEEDSPGQTNFALLSHRLWRRRFGADPAIAGKSIRLRDQSYTVTGVLPAGFALFDEGIDLWIPIGLNPNDPRGAIGRNLIVIARLAKGATLDAARTEMDAIGSRLRQVRPGFNGGWMPSILRLEDELVGPVRPALLVLLGAVALLLLIGCANVANLLLARAAGREKEMSIRAALGAGRGRIVRQLLTESVLLGLMGGAAGLLLAAVGIRGLISLAPASIPRIGEAGLDLRLLAFTFTVSVLTGVLFGLVPALEVSRTNLSSALKEGGRGGTQGRAAKYLRDALVVGEMALAVVVLIAAGLLVQSFLRLRAADPGFRPANLLTLRVPLAGGRNAAELRRIAFFQQLLDRVVALPGVRAASGVSALPLTGLGIGTTFLIAGRPVPPPEDQPIVPARAASPGYHAAIGLPLRSGRAFTEFDTREAPGVAIVNETMARTFWPGASPIGSRLTLDTPARTVQVVGVVGDTHADRIENQDWPTIYVPYAQAPSNAMTLVIRTAGDPLALAGAITASIRQLDPDQPVADVRSMEQVLAEGVAASRFNALLLAVFAGVAFVLAAVGIYGVISYHVSERTREFGIRLAMGAVRSDILRLVMLRAILLGGLGIGIGLGAALALTRLLASLLYLVEARDLPTFLAIVLALGAVALIASFVPARRALAIDPVMALRHD